MRILLKIVLFPITLILTIALLVAKAVLYVGGGILGVVAILFLIIGIGGCITGDAQPVGIPALIFAWALSPFGLPLIAVFIIANVELFRDWLKAI